MKIEDDPTIERIRRARHEISEQNGHDSHRLVEYYIELHKKYAARLLASPEGREVLPARGTGSAG